MPCHTRARARDLVWLSRAKRSTRVVRCVEVSPVTRAAAFEEPDLRKLGWPLRSTDRRSSEATVDDDNRSPWWTGTSTRRPLRSTSMGNSCYNTRCVPLPRETQLPPTPLARSPKVSSRWLGFRARANLTSLQTRPTAHLVHAQELDAKVRRLRDDVKETKKTFDKTEDDLKALQSMGQIIGEVLRQLDDEKCAWTGTRSIYRSSFIFFSTRRCDDGARRQFPRRKHKHRTRLATDTSRGYLVY